MLMRAAMHLALDPPHASAYSQVVFVLCSTRTPPPEAERKDEMVMVFHAHCEKKMAIEKWRKRKWPWYITPIAK